MGSEHVSASALRRPARFSAIAVDIDEQVAASEPIRLSVAIKILQPPTAAASGSRSSPASATPIIGAIQALWPFVSVSGSTVDPFLCLRRGALRSLFAGGAGGSGGRDLMVTELAGDMLLVEAYLQQSAYAPNAIRATLRRSHMFTFICSGPRGSCSVHCAFSAPLYMLALRMRAHVCWSLPLDIDSLSDPSSAPPCLRTAQGDGSVPRAHRVVAR